MEPAKAHMVARLIELMESVFLTVRPPSADEWSEVELTKPQLRTLVLLHRSQSPQRMSDLAVNLGVSLPSATGLVERLLSKGLVERGHDASDRRVVTCHLTPKGTDEAERLRRLARQEIEAVAEALTEPELNSVVEAMMILATALERRSARDGHLSVQERQVG